MTPRNVRLGILLASLLLTVACSGHGGTGAGMPAGGERDAVIPPSGPVDFSTVLPQLSQVGAVLDSRKQGSFSSDDGHRDGDNYDADLYSSNVSSNPPSALFVPEYVQPKSGLDGLAVAIYTFTLPDYTGDPVVFDQSWSSRPAQGDTYIALGNWDTMSWHWFEAPADDSEAFQDFAPYIRGDNHCVVAVAVMGNSNFQLDWLQFATQQAPVADLQVDVDSGPAPLTVSFDASASYDPDGTITDFEWDLDGDDTFNEAGDEAAARGSSSASHTYAAPGTYLAKVRVTDNAGVTDIALREINPGTGQPPQAVLMANPQSGDKPLTVSFNAAGSTDPDGVITDYEWDLDGNGVYNEELQGEDQYRGAQTAQYTYLSAGDFDATVRVTDNEGNKDTAFVTIHVTNAPPVAAINATPPSGPAPLDVVFDALDSTDDGGTIIDVEWDLDGNGVFNEPGMEADARGNFVTGTYQYNDPGDYSPSVRVTDDDGAQDTAGTVVHATNDPPVADLQANVTEGDAPVVVSFDAGASYDPDGSIVDIEWDLDGDGTFNEPGAEAAARGNTAPPPYTYTDPGAYNAKVRVTDNFDAQDTASLDITAHGWVLVTVDAPSDANTGVWCDLALINGHPAIAYQENTNHYLMYAYSTTATGSQAADWAVVTIPTPGLLWPGTDISLAEVDGGPALTEHDGATGFYYHRATTPTGSDPDAWSTQVQISSSTLDGNYTSLAVVSGNPAVVYDNDSNHTLVYCRSSSTTGDQASDWSNKVVIDGGGGIFAAGGSLAVIEGNPAVAYGWQGPIDIYVKYCRATTDTGGSAADWSTKWNVYGPFSTGDVGISLAVVGGNPAVSFATYGTGIQYSLANNSKGTSWAAPVIVEANVNSFTTSLAVINGNPAVAYVDFDSKELFYSRATTASGSSAADWDADELVVGGTTEVGNFGPLVEVDGKYAAIAYWDITQGASAGSCNYAVKF